MNSNTALHAGRVGTRPLACACNAASSSRRPVPRASGRIPEPHATHRTNMTVSKTNALRDSGHLLMVVSRYGRNRLMLNLYIIYIYLYNIYYFSLRLICHIHNNQNNPRTHTHIPSHIRYSTHYSSTIHPPPSWTTLQTHQR